MIDLLRDLIAHKAYADAALLGAIRGNPGAVADPELSELLHHILIANRFWLLTVQGLPFVLEEESSTSSTFDGLVARYAANHEQERAWVETATDRDLERPLENPLIPHGGCSVIQALMQVCLHSQGHRSQCAKLLRRHGGVPPRTDFILWLKDRPEPHWM